MDQLLLADAEDVPRPSTPQPRTGRFVPNLVGSAAGFGITVLIGLWFTPYLIRELGVATYGLVPLATTVTSYLGILTLTLNAAVSRNLTISLERGDLEEATRVFNTSLFGSLGLVAILAGPGVWLASRADDFFSVPPGQGQQFVWLSLCVLGAFLVTTAGTPFSVTMYARNRYDLRNVLNILANGVRVGIPVALFALLRPTVVAVGVGVLVSSVVLFGGYVLAWRALIPSLRVRVRSFRWQTVRLQMTMSVWLVVAYGATLLLLSIDLVVANRVLGPVAAGEYAAVMTWSTFLRSYASTVGGIFGPRITALFARDDKAGLATYAQRSAKFVGIMIALPVGLVCGLSRPLLHVWLGPQAEGLAPLMMLMTIHLSVNLGTQPLQNVQVATNRMRVPALVGLAAGLVNVILAVVLSGAAGWGMYGIAAAGAFVLTAWNLLFLPLHVAHVIGQPRRQFYADKLPVAAATIVLTAAGWLLSHYLSLNTWAGVILVSLMLAAVYVAAAYRLLLTAEERAIALRLMRPRAARR